MSDTATMVDSRQIVVDEVFPHALEVVWKTLTTPGMMGRWLHMKPAGFAPVARTRFTYQTTPAGEWDGVIQCEVLEAVPLQRLAFAWRGGHEGNVGYGSRLDTVVTFTLAAVEGGTRVRLVHSGFVLPKNETAFQNMSNGWTKVIQTIGALAEEHGEPTRGA
jgi:uncharacterized protein YndB with AHSA1/START domain